MSSRRRPSMVDVLPENVISDVVSRLPVKTIMRCKCVCKKWRDLVSNPYFVHLQLSRSRDALMISTLCRPRILKWVEIGQNEADNNPNYSYVKRLDLKDCAPIAKCWATSLVGSVNGLICSVLSSNQHDGFYIFNPVLEEYMTLPQPPQQHLGTLGLGFGVSRAGEYKVIRISPVRSVESLESLESLESSESLESYEVNEVEIEVYTLGTGKWRIMGQSPYRLVNPMHDEGLCNGVFVNNHVYWLVDAEMYEFDLDTETFGLFTSPPRDNEEVCMEKLGVLKGRLSRVSWCSLGLEVWVMKEESWCKEISIQQNIESHLLGYEPSPLCVLDGPCGTSVMIVLDYKTRKLVAYCLNSLKFVHLNMKGYGDPITTYRPSFIKLRDFGSERVDALYNSESREECVLGRWC